MHLEKINREILHAIYTNEKSLALAFGRVIEHQNFLDEGYLTFKEFENWYAKNQLNSQEKKLDYWCYWSGYGVHKKLFRPFIEGKFNPLTPQEKKLLKSLKLYPEAEYVIGTSEKSSLKTFYHEIAHGFFSTNNAYAKDVLNILGTIPFKKRKNIENFLSKEGYAEKNFIDETHAYLLVNLNLLKEWGVDITPFWEVQKELKKVFNKYCPKRFLEYGQE